ncbi:TPA: helix-turn-helix domain-containing protein [Streptococcus suis]
MFYPYVGSGNAVMKIFIKELRKLYKNEEEILKKQAILECMRLAEKFAITHLFEMTPQDIRQLRQNFLMDQEKFAKFLRVSLQSINAWELGTRKPEGRNLQKLAYLMFLGDEEKQYVRETESKSWRQIQRLDHKIKDGLASKKLNDNVQNDNYNINR